MYQLQIAGFLLGHDGTGQPCTTYCIVPWAGTELDLNAVILYLNAFTFGLGGCVTLFLSAYSDYWRKYQLLLEGRPLVADKCTNPGHKHVLVTVSIVCYGAFSVPAYWLQEYTLHNFYTLSALYIIFQVVTLVLMALLNIYIPHCMHRVVTTASNAGEIS